MSLSIKLLDSQSLESYLENYLESHLEGLANILVDGVESGASISFLQPFSMEEARNYWKRDVFPEVARGGRLLFAAISQGEVVGTVQLVTELAANQKHRCEVSKLIVHSSARRQGIGRRLLETALDHATRQGKKLVTLDTRTGDVSQRLYNSIGFQVAGEIPDFALDPDRDHLSPTTYMYKRL